MVSEQEKFNALCSHYKDTFDNHKETAKQRDMLFYSLLVVAAVFTLQISSIDTVTSVVDQYVNKNIGISLGINSDFVSTALWLILLGVTTKYFQKVIEIEGQYKYLHAVEDELNKYFGDASEAFTREGKAYSKNFQSFSKWAGLLYTSFFPIILLVVVVARIYTEVWQTQKLTINIIVDGVSCLVISISIILYLIKMHETLIGTLSSSLKRIARRLFHRCDNPS